LQTGIAVPISAGKSGGRNYDCFQRIYSWPPRNTLARKRKNQSRYGKIIWMIRLLSPLNLMFLPYPQVIWLLKSSKANAVSKD